MKNRIEQDVTIYEKSNIYEYDNSIMMHYYPKRIVEILKTQNTYKKIKCLELGIGHGYTTEYFATYFDDYTVLDGDEKIINKFVNEHPDFNVKIVKTYFEEFCTNEKYDVIICGFVLEHVDNPDKILNKYKNMLTPNGKIFITVPNAEALNRRIGLEGGLLKDIFSLSEHDIRCGHKRYYSMSSLEKEVKDCGLEILVKEGLFLKPITTAQMIKLDLKDEVIEGMLKVGKDYPELCLGLLVEAN
mgnify:CR=1 FL=1|jgi:methyltransferase type 12